MLVKKHRQRPLSGVVLTISAEALLCDDKKLTQRKASLMVNELLRLTGTLNMYLPCYVVITKLDTVLGFREYFKDLSDSAKNQIFGFQPLTDHGDFNEDEYENFFASLQKRIRDGALGLMESREVMDLTLANRSRMGLTGDIYLFEQNLLKIKENLALYLESVFGRTLTSSKIYVQFKGFYFTSALDKGFSLNERFALMQDKPIDEVPLYDNNFKHSRPYFISTLISKLVIPTREARFNRREILKRRIPAFITCAVLLAVSGIYWYGVLVSGPELKLQMEDSKYYYNSLANQFRQGQIDSARILAADYQGNGVVLGDLTMPNDRRITRINFFTDAQRRTQLPVNVPWHFFPASVIQLGFSPASRFEGRFAVYDQMQYKMAYLPLTEALEYNLLVTGKAPYSKLKRDALMELASIALFGQQNRAAIRNDVYDKSTMMTFMEYMFPQSGTTLRANLSYFLPDYDYYARANNASLVLDRNFTDSCNQGLRALFENWETLSNYPESDYAELRDDVSAATRLIDIEEELSELKTLDFSKLSGQRLQEIVTKFTADVHEYQGLVSSVNDMTRFFNVATAPSGSQAQDGGKDKNDAVVSQYAGNFEVAYRNYLSQLGDDFAFLKNYDDLRRKSGVNDTGIYFRDLNFSQMLTRRPIVEGKLHAEYSRLTETINDVEQKELFDRSSRENARSPLNYQVLSDLFTLFEAELKVPEITHPTQSTEGLREIAAEFSDKQEKLGNFAQTYGNLPYIRSWIDLCSAVAGVQYDLARLAYTQKLLALYPDDPSDLSLLSELTLMVADYGDDLGDLGNGFSMELAKQILGDFEFRQEYNPQGFMDYFGPLALIQNTFGVKLIQDEKEKKQEQKDQAAQTAQKGHNVFNPFLTAQRDKLMRLAAAFNRYAGAYINYWSHIADSIHPVAESYAEFYDLANSTKAYQVNSQLQEMYSVGYRAIEQLDSSVLTKNVASLQESSLNQLDGKIKSISIEFTDECTDVLSAWSALGEDATFANRKVMNMSDKQVKTSLLSLGKGSRASAGVSWWQYFTQLGSRLLKRDASGEASTSLSMFQGQLKFFPLVKDGNTHAKVLSKNDIKQLSLMFKSFGLSEPPKAEQESVLPGFALEDAALRVDNDLQAPLVFSQDSTVQSRFKVWSQTMERILSLLGSEDKTSLYKLQRLDAKTQNRLREEQGLTGTELAMARYRYFTVSIGEGEQSDRLSSFDNDVGANAFAQGKLDNQSITFRFYKFSDSQEPDCVYTIDGGYPSLQLYLSENAEFDDQQKQSSVPLMITDNTGLRSVFFIGIGFTKDLPAPDDWPALADWPDASLFAGN